jgi:sulfite exporter TauE/SafE
MCGGFPLAVMAGSKSKGARAIRSLLYNSGRGVTYLILAGFALVAGFGLGNAAARAAEIAQYLAMALSVFAGLVMAAAGLMLLGVRLPLLGAAHSGGIADWVAKAGRGIIHSPHPMAPVTVGIINGLLPCPLVYGMLATVLALGALKLLAPGLWVAVGFAAGTLPVMAAIALVGGPLMVKYRARLARVSGALLLVFATVTIVRGLSPNALHAMLPGDHSSHEEARTALGNGHFMVGSTHFDPQGNIMTRPDGMDDADYLLLVESEAKLAEEVARLIAAGDVVALRLLNRAMSAPAGMHAYTLMPDEMAAMLASPDTPEQLDYRCPCCGTPKKQHRDFLKMIDTSPGYAGFTLLLPDSMSRPWGVE